VCLQRVCVFAARIVPQVPPSNLTVPGVEPSFSQPIRDNVLESISQIDGQIVVKVFGDDVDILRRLADDVLRTTNPIRGVARAFADRAGQVPQLQIQIDRPRAVWAQCRRRRGCDRDGARGKAATQLWEGERRFDVVVRLGEEERHDESSIGSVLVDTPSRLRIPVGGGGGHRR
jgi:cobalt-zinc-cadmium resistance protein CzcA